jgi:uncharacterized membrane protein
MRRFTALAFLLLLLCMSASPSVSVLTKDQSLAKSPSNPTGVDVLVTDVAVAYTSSSDASKYKMFSSNHPILGFNRPAELYVIDGMLNVSSTLTITVENIGTASSGVIDVNILLLHNEYTYFEFVNESTQMATLGGGDSNTITVPITPTYAGNHTVVVRATSTVSDDVPSNDASNGPFTVGSDYFNCDSTAAWTLNGGWALSTDTSISQGRSCHAGNGQSSTYNNNMMASMTTPVMDLSDALLNPTRTNGLSFFYTGSSAANDKLTMYGRNAFGAWSEIGSVSGTIDQTFADGANWQTFSFNNKGASSPLMPVAQDLFHSTSQFKYEFTSDATGTDLGFYIDDIVMVYDQKVRPNEYNVSAQGVSTTGAIPGEWGSITMKIVNTGNITETFTPTLQGLPTGWNAYFTRPSGTSFDPLAGLFVAPGAPQEFNIMIQPDVNASIGLKQMSVSVSSQAYASVTATLPVQFLVKADRIPVIVQPPVRPSCPPSYTCTFEVNMTNEGDATDVFDLVVDTSTVPASWTVALAWTQPSSVQIRPDETVPALFTMTVPQGVAPDTVVTFEMRLQAQNDTSRIDIRSIDVSASMISVAAVDMVESEKAPRLFIDAGEDLRLHYQIWNNATRQDIFSMRVEVEEAGTWIVEQPTRPNAVLNAGGTTTFEVVVRAPSTAQANDRGPRLTPVIESQRSNMVIGGDEFNGLRVTTTHDVAVQILEAPSKLNPGLPTEISLLVTNQGNGPASVLIYPTDLPPSWTWWLTEDGNNQTEAIELSVSYDLQHERSVSLWLLLPVTEAAGEVHTVAVQAALEGEGVDVKPDNNAVEFVATTGAVRVPSLVLETQSSSAIAGGVAFAEAHLTNEGNALEDRLSVTATVTSSPPTSGLIVFFTVEGGDRAVGSPNALNIAPGATQRLRLEVLLPQEAPLNTRLVLKFDVEGAVDETGLPKTMVAEAMVMLDQRRSMSSEVDRFIEGTVAHGTAAGVWVNHTSTSTFTESYSLKVDSVEGWQVTCDKRLVNATGTTYELTPGHITPQTRQHVCEVLRLSGPLDGVLTFTIVSTDGVLRHDTELKFSFAAPPEEEGVSRLILVSGGIGFSLLATLVTLMLVRRRHDVETKAYGETPEIALAGPPVGHGDSGGQPIEEANSGQPGDETIAVHQGPPIPDTGLPDGWTQEQWVYYGQQYLDGTL